MAGHKIGRYVRLPIFWVLIVVGVGTALLPMVVSTGHYYLDESIKHFSQAASIACFLGATIDRWLKARIVEDVFGMAVGYGLPDDLRDEMRAVYSNRIICQRHIQTVELKELGDDLVELLVSLERTLENVGGVSERLEIKLGIDEWFFPGHTSQILEFKYRLDADLIDVDLTRHVKRRNAGLEASIGTNGLTLRPGQTVTVLQKYREIKRSTDSHTIQFAYGTRNPSVDVRHSQGIDCNLGFSHRLPTEQTHYGKKYILTGLMLPHQPIGMHWWSRPANDRWLQETSEVGEPVKK